MHKLRSGDSNARQLLAAVAAIGLLGGAVGLFAVVMSERETEPDTEQAADAAPTEQLALQTADCAAIEAAADAVVATGHIGHDASVALGELRLEVPPEMHADIDVLVETYSDLDAGQTELLLDDVVVEATSEAGIAIADYLADTCGIDWSQS